jgi:hypothetical protein
MAGGKGKITPKDGEKTRFTSDNQPANQGRKPGTQAWKDVLAKMMPEEGYLTFRDVQEVDADGRPTGNVFKAARVKMATQEMITMAAIKQAMKGDMRAIVPIWDRMDGKATQPLAGDPENPITANIQWITKK